MIKIPEEAYAEHDWWDKPPHENTRCRRCSIKYGYFWEYVRAGRFDFVRCDKVVDFGTHKAVLIFTDVKNTDVFNAFGDFCKEAEKKGLKRTRQTWLMKKKIVREKEFMNFEPCVAEGMWGKRSYEIYVMGGRAIVKIVDKGIVGIVEYHLGSLCYDAVITLEEEAEG